MVQTMKTVAAREREEPDGFFAVEMFRELQSATGQDPDGTAQSEEPNPPSLARGSFRGRLSAWCMRELFRQTVPQRKSPGTVPSLCQQTPASLDWGETGMARAGRRRC